MFYGRELTTDVADVPVMSVEALARRHAYTSAANASDIAMMFMHHAATSTYANINMELEEAGVVMSGEVGMGITEKRRRFACTCEVTFATEVVSTVLVDTGAEPCLLSYGFYKRLRMARRELRLNKRDRRQVKVADGKTVWCEGSVSVPVKIGDYNADIRFEVLRSLPYNALLGMEFLEGRAIIDLRERCVRFPGSSSVPLTQAPSRVMRPVTLVTTEDVSVPPKHELVITVGPYGNAYVPDGTTGLVGRYQEADTGVVAGSTFAEMRNGVCNVLVGNFRERWARIPAGTPVATLLMEQEDDYVCLASYEDNSVVDEGPKGKNSPASSSDVKSANSASVDAKSSEAKSLKSADCLREKRGPDTAHSGEESGGRDSRVDTTFEHVFDTSSATRRRVRSAGTLEQPVSAVPHARVGEDSRCAPLACRRAHVQEGGRKPETERANPHCSPMGLINPEAAETDASQGRGPILDVLAAAGYKTSAPQQSPQSEMKITDEDLHKCAEGVSGSMKEELRALLHKHIKVFADKTGHLGKVTSTEHVIETETSRPPSSRMYPLARPEQDAARDAVNDQLRLGIIQPSTSPWRSPVLFAKKKDGSLRFCVDYRALNKVTKKDAYPMPRADDILDRAGGYAYYTTMDLASGYWQVPIREEDRHKTAFATPMGLFEYNYMPFGLTNAPATCQRLMDVVLAGVKWQHCLVYLDDIIVFSNTPEEHMRHVGQILEMLEKHGLTLKLSKCRFFQPKVEYLGHVLSKEGVMPDPAKVETLKKWPAPTDVSALRTFLGMTGYYRKFIPHYAVNAFPLNELLRKDVAWRWGEEEERAFRYLIDTLASDRVLAPPNFDLPFLLQTDGCKKGFGAVLSQIHANGAERPIAFISRSTKETERNWSTTDLEAGAAVWACETFRHYLLGRNFTLITDHTALKQVLGSSKPGKHARWTLRLMEFAFEIVHRKGRLHANADAPSRYPLPLTKEQLQDPAPMDLHAVEIVADGKDGKSGTDSKYIPSMEDPLLITPAIVLPDRDALRTAIAMDVDFKDLVAYLRGDAIATSEDRLRRLQQMETVFFLDEDGVLWKDVDSRRKHASKPSSQRRERRRPCLVVPKTWRLNVIKFFHDSVYGSHLGWSRTAKRIAETFWWPKMWKDIECYVRSCISCQRFKPGVPKSHGRLQPVMLERPFTTWHIDHFGPMPEAPSGSKYVMIAVEEFSSYPEAIPCASPTFEVALELLWRVVNTWGCFQRCVSDRGGMYTHEAVKMLCKRLGGIKIETTAYHPQSNSRAERVIRFLNAAIGTFARYNHRLWERYLISCLGALRMSPLDGLPYSPLEVLTGQRPANPADVTAASGRSLPQTVEEYHRSRLRDMERAHAALRKFINERRLRHKELYDADKKDVCIEVGEQVMVYTPPRGDRKKATARRFVPRFDGPFDVVKVRPPLLVKVKLATGAEDWIHVNRLRRFADLRTARGLLETPAQEDASRSHASDMQLDSSSHASSNSTTSGQSNTSTLSSATAQQAQSADVKHVVELPASTENSSSCDVPVDGGSHGGADDSKAGNGSGRDGDAKSRTPRIVRFDPDGGARWAALRDLPHHLRHLRPRSLQDLKVRDVFVLHESNESTWHLGAVVDVHEDDGSLTFQYYGTYDVSKPIGQRRYSLTWYDGRGVSIYASRAKGKQKAYCSSCDFKEVAMARIGLGKDGRLPSEVATFLEEFEKVYAV